MTEKVVVNSFRVDIPKLLQKPFSDNRAIELNDIFKGYGCREFERTTFIPRFELQYSKNVFSET